MCGQLVVSRLSFGSSEPRCQGVLRNKQFLYNLKKIRFKKIHVSTEISTLNLLHESVHVFFQTLRPLLHPIVAPFTNGQVNVV